MAEPIRFYFDQHIQGAVAHGLRQHGLDVLTAQDAGRCGLPDPDQLAFAAGDDRVMVTFDSDYLALHQAGVRHALESPGSRISGTDRRIGHRRHEESRGVPLIGGRTQTAEDLPGESSVRARLDMTIDKFKTTP